MKLPIIIVTVFVLLVFLFILVASSRNYTYEGKIYPGVLVAGIDVGGQTIDEVRPALEARISDMIKKGLTFKYNGTSADVSFEVIPVSGVDIAREIVLYDIDKTLDRAYVQGRRYPDVFRNAVEQYFLMVNGTDVPFSVTIDPAEFNAILENKFSAFSNPGNNARLTVQGATYIIEPEVSGTTLDFNAALQEALSRVQTMNKRPILIAQIDDTPEITTADINAKITQVDELLTLAPVTFHFEDKTWSLTRESLFEWIRFEKQDGFVALQLDGERQNEFFQRIADDIAISAQDAEWKIVDSRVKAFRLEQKGRELDRDALAADVQIALFQEHLSDVMIQTKVVEPKVSLSELNDFGIVELIARGETSFAGSPANRRHNISVGSSALDGLIVKPGEVFSVIGHLGAINASNGYKPELVIRGNETTPEFGGGLCQVSTTLFRAVLNAGLPVVERQNHSYRVSYYEPPVGMDATIYSPKPDFRFKNDFAKAILIKAHIEGSNLVFEIFGEKDGRIATSSEPKVFNITKPPETKFIETADLPPGEKKCIERAHNGASAEFTYTVQYPDKEPVITVFKSLYRPWQAVCLVGIDPDAPPVEEGDALLPASDQLIPLVPGSENTNTN